MGKGLVLQFISIALLVSHVLSASEPKVVNVALEKSFTPIGFDDNDRVQVTVAGMFPSGCYRVGPYFFETDLVNQTISIRQTAYFYPSECLQVLVPFSQVINLNFVREGTFTLKDAVSGKELGKLPVSRAKTTQADDYLYAPVTDASIRMDGGKSYLDLKGNFTSRCMKIKDVVVNYFKDVVVVQPIAEFIGTPHNCGHEMIRFAFEAPLNDGLSGTQLLHVRVQDGQAINRIVEFP